MEKSMSQPSRGRCNSVMLHRSASADQEKTRRLWRTNAGDPTIGGRFQSFAEEFTMRRVSFTLLCCLLATSPVSAEVTSLTVLHRKPFAGGKSFGDAGPYEQIVGIAKF